MTTYYSIVINAMKSLKYIIRKRMHVVYIIYYIYFPFVLNWQIVAQQCFICALSSCSMCQ